MGQPACPPNRQRKGKRDCAMRMMTRRPICFSPDPNASRVFPTNAESAPEVLETAGRRSHRDSISIVTSITVSATDVVASDWRPVEEPNRCTNSNQTTKGITMSTKITMSTNTTTKESNVEVELRPLKDHELEIVSGGLPAFLQAGPQMEGAYLTVGYGIG
jgi:hypothetical protein